MGKRTFVANVHQCLYPVGYNILDILLCIFHHTGEIDE